MFNNKIILITGGTGSFGNAVLRRLIKTDIAEIRIFSRDEKKQDDMRKSYRDTRIKYYLGDVRDFQSILNVTRGSNYIFHAAALKQVPSCEFHPLEAVKTNIIGTENVLEASIISEVDRVIVLSTDKAVYPINSMGISKAMAEKVALAKSKNSNKTNINITRYGNVLFSRGSVIPLFLDQIKNDKPITLTDPNMTRFVMSLDEAVDLVFYAFKNGKPGETFVQKAPSTTIRVLAKALCETINKKNYPFEIIGTRQGEKLYEVLLSREEIVIAKDLGKYFCIPPNHDGLNYEKYVEKGELKITHAKEYNSHNTDVLDVEEVKSIFSDLEYLKSKIKDI